MRGAARRTALGDKSILLCVSPSPCEFVLRGAAVPAGFPRLAPGLPPAARENTRGVAWPIPLDMASPL